MARLPLHRHSLPQLLADAVLVALAFGLAFWFRFDNDIPPRYEDLLYATIGPATGVAIVIFVLFRLYDKFWRYAGQRDYLNVVQAVVIATLFVPAYVAVFKPVTWFVDNQVGRGYSAREITLTIPSSVIVLYFLLLLVFIGGSRFLARLFYERPIAGWKAPKGASRVLIVGAGDGGRLVLREILRNPQLALNPVGFVDDDPTKRGIRVDGVKVLGHTGELERILDEAEPDEVTIAIPSAPGTLRAGVVAACRARSIPVRTLPTVFELLQTGGPVVRQVRAIEVEDVLGREPVVMELDRVGSYLRHEVVMVTGAGGSIGAELSRQIARVAPRRLVLVDHAEDNLFTIQRELEDDRHVQPASLAAVLADCKEGERMREVFAEFRPTIVFHAAAYKHVGMMERNPVEAVRNNSIATRTMAHIAGEMNVKRFVLVSTDKAVSPATVMGASKALAECAVEEAQQRYAKTRYAIVRFGNVLGSSGSVVPIFRRQIALGGPVTVTDRRMTRYFMTIPEAVQLIIRSGSLGEGGEIFVLEMGEPVSIYELAKSMIELSGLRPDVDIAIEVVGRRPGEKLHEELLNPFERAQPTPAEKIVRAERTPLDADAVQAMFDEVGLLVLEGDGAGLAARVAELTETSAEIPDATALP
ncbi:MAG TPA: nucleoside-diphosphate sugar epimerase/dehydratase [Baekduia sp.]|nr:nucleoside-diphosphate sugar epimerase/dehydratase [Baekduia sp.]